MTDASYGATRRLAFGAVAALVFGLIRRHPMHIGVLTLLLGVLPTAVFGLLRVFGIVTDPGTDPVAAMRGAPGESIVVWLTGLFLQAGLIRAALDDAAGVRPEMARSLRAGSENFLPLLGISLLTGIGIFLGLLLLIIPGVYLALRWMVAAPVQVAERRGVFASMERSSKLTDGSKWTLLGLVVVGVLLTLVALVVVSIPVGLLDELGTGGVLTNLVFDPLVGGAASTAFNLLSVAAYLELRRVREGGYAAEVSVFD